MSKIKVHNVQTGEVTERDMTSEEVAQKAIDQAAETARIAAEEAKAEAKAALLEQLGITEEQAKLLLS
jgi:hypothetical protein